MYQLLGLDAERTIEELGKRARARVEDVNFEDAKVMGKSVRDLPLMDLQKKLLEAFPTNPFELLAVGWGQVREVKNAVAKSRTAPKHEVSHLGQHDLEASLEPRLVLTVDGIDWCTIRLTAILQLRVQAAELVFDDGSLTAVTLGNPVGTVSLKVEGHEVADCKRELDISDAPFRPHAINMPTTLAGS